jgi:hypothetical protein
LKCSKLLLLVFLLCSFPWLRGQNATITGIILDENNAPLVNVNVTAAQLGTYSDEAGFYSLQLRADEEITVTFTHLAHQPIVLKKLLLTTNETFVFNPVMRTDEIQIEEVVVTSSGERSAAGITRISPEVIRNIPGANAGVEQILKLLPGVNSNNELSTQFSVRGGNYDENLVYINEIEVYRPFLIRSGQQEGLSFVHSGMVQKVEFSSGGFQAKYGDKLSSVLDITYKIPELRTLQIEASLLGAALTAESISKNRRFNNITGVRFRDNSLLLNSMQTRGTFNPTFLDIQNYASYNVSKKIQIGFLGNLSLNRYQNKPQARQTNFGTLNNPKALLIYYTGEENNRYFTGLAAVKTDYFLNENVTLKLISSLYHTTEEEFSDISAQYELGEIDANLGSENLGEVTSSRGIGTQLNRARNELDALIFNLEHKGKYYKNKAALEWGLKYSHEDIRDQIRESEFIDSLGFFIRPPFPEFSNNQPLEPFESPIVPIEHIRALNFVKTNRFSGFLQFGRQTAWKEHALYYNLGLRAQYWTVSGRDISKSSSAFFSPRAQLAMKPKWERDMLFRLSTGLYHQPPFYRELRDFTGTIVPDVKAQRAVHLVLGNEYSFLLWERPFKLITEGYYKKLNEVNTYTIEDVRIRYAANNAAKAYVYGFEMRLNGAFVPGTESWVSLGYLKTEENINNRGYISRPTDQRLKLGILFQDYVPTVPNLKMYLNLVYQTGVPGGSPNYADPYDFQNRLRDYKRADLGISHIFVDANSNLDTNHWLRRFKELSAGVEIFNLFNNQNAITNTWVTDVDTKQQFAVPNFMTTRVLNLKINMRF